MAAPDRGANRHRGVTLIELLVVVAVMAILLGAVLHMMQPAVKEMKVREGSRTVRSFLVGAQSRAAEIGRPVGVIIEPFRQRAADGTETPTGAAYQLFIAETPPPFAGDTMRAVATVSDDRRYAMLDNTTSTMLTNYDRQDIEGGSIRFNFRGPFYEITEFDGVNVWFKSARSVKTVNSTTIQVKDDSLDPARFREPPAPGETPYQIFPRPIKTSSAPLDVPQPLVIDIQNSGFNKNGLYKPFVRVLEPLALSRESIIISFAPNGAIDRVYAVVPPDNPSEAVDSTLRAIPHQPTGAVHLMVGWGDQLGEANLRDFTTRWVSIGPTTGRIITSENGGIDNGGGIHEALEFAEKGLGMTDLEAEE
jgi:prepilin-type N-terminal cleavage/methylation domain-containing protein